MQTVSQAWLNNQKQTFVDESFVEVSLDIGDPDAIADASSEDNGAAYISNTPQVVSEVDKNIVPYSTLEQNLWILDGSRKILPQGDYGDCGYIGDVLSDSNGSFSAKTPKITIDFTEVHSNLIPGMTIVWGSAYNEYATDFIVTAYNGGTVVAEKEIRSNNSVKSIVNMDIVNYNRITVSILRWCLPFRRARIEEIFVGINKVYTKRELFKYSHKQTSDPLSTSLPKAEVSFSIDNTDNSYNPHNANGMSKYLMQRQEIKTRYGYKLGNDIEWIKGGTFYLSEWDAPQNGISAEFKARDLLEFMSAKYYEGVYAPGGVDLYSLALRIIEKADLPLNSDGTVKWSIDESLKNIYTTAPLPVDTLANNLQLIANAGGCALYQDRNGILRVERIGDEATDYAITHNNSYSKSNISLAKPLKQVNVKVYQYFEGDAEELYKGTLSIDGTVEIMVTYSGTAINVAATITGGTLVSAKYYANACILTIAANGEVEIKVDGNGLESSNIEVITSSGTNGEIISVDNPLITSRERAVVLGAWMENYLKNRMSLSSSWRVDPRLDVLDIVENENEYNTVNVRMTTVEFTYEGAFNGNGEGRVI